MEGKNMSGKWICCPCCGWHLIRRRPDTAARNLPLYCKRCHNVSLFDIAPEPESQSHHLT
ncbi:cysteine-rich KTR domain-containing protein [Butyricicoccus porcorum]|uniref:cysteine-rich KTR domain-containing protein n=1 Tax=Butyricicoccus porcorum TaxID=1945634 RepID=UPI003F4AE9E8